MLHHQPTLIDFDVAYEACLRCECSLKNATSPTATQRRASVASGEKTLSISIFLTYSEVSQNGANLLRERLAWPTHVDALLREVRRRRTPDLANRIQTFELKADAVLSTLCSWRQIFVSLLPYPVIRLDQQDRLRPCYTEHRPRRATFSSIDCSPD